MNEKMSIYETILKQREDDSSLPYTFQDPQLAGREDTLFILMTDGISFTQKEEIALQCCQIIKEMLTRQTDTAYNKIQPFLKQYPMRLFFIELRERLKALLEEELIDSQELNKLGMRLVKTSTSSEEVKLGIMILGLYPNDLTMKVLRTLGFHSDYTVYAAESIRQSATKENQFLFELLQNTDGYGRLAALFLIKAVSDEQKEWIINHSIKSDFLSSIYVNVALQKADIRHYLLYSPITAENYRHSMYVLAYREPTEEGQLADDMLLFMRKMVDAREFATSFIEQAGLVMIWLQVIDSWKRDYAYLEKQLDKTEQLSDYWDQRFNNYEEMIRMIEVFLNKPKWQHVALQELKVAKETDFLIVSVLQFLEMKPEMADFMPRLAANPLGLNLLDFFLANNPLYYFEEVCYYLSNLLSDHVFDLPFKFEEEIEKESRDLFKLNIWMETLFKTMLEKDLFALEWCLDALNYYHPKIRRLALQALRKYQDLWEEEDVDDALESLFEFEENKRNIRILRRLLKKEDDSNKEKMNLPLPYIISEPALTDKKLLDTYIAGMTYRDLSIVEELIKRGKILQLVREKDNEFDRYAIGITMEDGYLIGYVPKADNRVLATLLDSNEKLYALVETDALEADETMISIYLRKTIEGPLKDRGLSRDNIVAFPSKK